RAHTGHGDGDRPRQRVAPTAPGIGGGGVMARDRAIIRVSGLTKSYPPGVTALAGVSFSVPAGEFVAVLGTSGAGKTTLFRCLTGLTRPDAGAVEIDGRD